MVELLALLVIGTFLFGCWCNAYRPEWGTKPDLEARKGARERDKMDRVWKDNPVAVKDGRIYKLHDPSVGEWEEWRDH